MTTNGGQSSFYFGAVYAFYFEINAFTAEDADVDPISSVTVTNVHGMGSNDMVQLASDHVNANLVNGFRINNFMFDFIGIDTNVFHTNTIPDLNNTEFTSSVSFNFVSKTGGGFNAMGTLDSLQPLPVPPTLFLLASSIAMFRFLRK